MFQIHPFISRLGRKNHRYKQLEGRAILQLGSGMGIGRLEASKDFLEFVRIHELENVLSLLTSCYTLEFSRYSLFLYLSALGQPRRSSAAWITACFIFTVSEESVGNPLHIFPLRLHGQAFFPLFCSPAQVFAT